MDFIILKEAKAESKTRVVGVGVDEADTSLLNRTLTSSESGSSSSSSSDEVSRASSPNQTVDSDDFEAGKTTLNHAKH